MMIFFGVTSCGAKKIMTSNKTEVVEINKSATFSSKAAEIAKKRYEDSIARKAKVFDIENDDNKVIIDSKPIDAVVIPKALNNNPNRVYNIAVILPFNLNQIPLGQYVDDSTKQLSNDSKNAIEFYLGCQMAKEKFKSQNLKTNVYFFDDKNDSLTFALLFTRKPFPNVDYVIAPIGYKNLKMASDLARNFQIPLISPIANSIYIKENNYFYGATTSLKGQYEFLLTQAKAKFPTKMLEVIYDGKDSTAESINILKEINDKVYTNSNAKFTSLRATDDIAKALTQTDTISQRIVLIYSSKEGYIKSVVAKLKAIKNDLQIFTSPTAKNSKALADVQYPHDIYTASQNNTGNINYDIFDDKFVAKYKKKPSEIAFQAYDLMMHLFKMLDKNQNLQDSYNYSIDFDNTQSKFQFKPVLNKNGNIDYYDNSFMYLYKYSSGNFTVVPN